MTLTIAIDGPAASGKGTISERVAAHYGLAYLDTGVLYRAVAARVLEGRAAPEDAAAATAAAQEIGPDDGARPDLRSAAVAAAASIVAAHPGVRAALLAYQRDFIANPPGGAPGAVLDGRDIGTVIAPQAKAKLFVTADAETRAERRWKQRVARGEAASYDDVLADILARDQRDSQRADAPMKPAEDAFLLDTTHLTIEEAAAQTIAYIETRR